MDLLFYLVTSYDSMFVNLKEAHYECVAVANTVGTREGKGSEGYLFISLSCYINTKRN